jgi:DDE family transposase
MDGFDKEVFRRLPLAAAALSLFNYALNEPFLDQLFAEHRGRGYDGLLSFATFVSLIRDALLVHGGHGLPAFIKAHEAGQLPVLPRSVYPKLARIELAVSKALLRESSQKMLGLMEESCPSPLPASLAAFTTITLDGKTLKHVRRQLKSLRSLRGKLLGGKLLVAQDLASGLALAFAASEDGHTNEIRLAQDLLGQIQSMNAVLSKPRLWMADAQFCDLNLMDHFSGDGGQFLIRYNRTLNFEPDASRPLQTGTDAKGRFFSQQWGWVGGVKDKRRCYVRQIRLLRADADELILLTNLLDALAYPVIDLLETYLLRWGIEQMFQSVTEVFCLRQLIGCTPKANIFQASFCLVIYDAIVVMRSYVAAAGNVTPEQVSTAKFFDDVQEELIAHQKLGTMDSVSETMAKVKTAIQMKDLLNDLLGDCWHERWLKAKSNHRRPRGPSQYNRAGHTSVFKAMNQYRERHKTANLTEGQRR